MKGLAELDERILAIEHRLIDREAGLLQRVHRLQARVENAPRRWVGPALAGVTAFAGMFLMARQRGRTRGASARVTAGKRVNWLHYVGLVWPLLPVQLRSRVSPETALPLMSLLPPLLEQVFPARRPMPPLATVPRADLDRFAGQWYEIARLPAPFQRSCRGLSTVDYRPRVQSPRAHGWPLFDVVAQCHVPGGRSTKTPGIGRAVEGSAGARLRVSAWPGWLRWWPGAWSDRWILHVDDEYTEALIGDPQRRYLVVLSRSATMAPDRLEALLTQAQQQGFDISRLVFPQP